MMMSTTMLFLLVSLICCVKASTTCPRGWLADEGACYLFGTSSVHFTEAESYCRQRGSHLVEVSNTHENSFLKTHLRQMKDMDWWIGLTDGGLVDWWIGLTDGGLVDWWIGMTDEAVESEWRWFDSDKLVQFTDWAKGEQNPISHDFEDCAMFGHTLDYAWADVRCTYSGYPLCEMIGETCNVEVIGR